MQFKRDRKKPHKRRLIDETVIWDIRRQWIERPTQTIPAIACRRHVGRELIIAALKREPSLGPLWALSTLWDAFDVDDVPIDRKRVREILVALNEMGRVECRDGAWVLKSTGRAPAEILRAQNYLAAQRVQWKAKLDRRLLDRA